MEVLKTLPSGRMFEKEVFGLTTEEVPFRVPPERLSLDFSIQHVIIENWHSFEKAIKNKDEYCHNPINPTMGKTGMLWEAVKKHLPRRVGGHTNTPLSLYVAVGHNSLDWWYGTDAFFWWQGVDVKIDVSLLPKDKTGALKADFLLSPEDFEPERLSIFGRKVADLLKTKRRQFRSYKKVKAPREKKWSEFELE